METLIHPSPKPQTIRELVQRLGDVPTERVRLHPPPGAATEDDVVELQARQDRLCELIDGTLVEKAMGFRESLVAAFMIRVLCEFVEAHNLGLVSGPDGMVRLFPGRVRIPDIAFFSWQRLPGRRIPNDPVPLLAPDLAVEIRSAGNTDAEMQIKTQEYLQAGVRLIWIVDLQLRKVTVCQPGHDQASLGEEDLLEGGEVLAGFSLSVHSIFARFTQE